MSKTIFSISLSFHVKSLKTLDKFCGYAIPIVDVKSVLLQGGNKMRLIPSFFTKPFVDYVRDVQGKNEPHLLDTTELGYRARKEYDRAVRLEHLLTWSLPRLLRKRNEILHPNPAQYI